MKNIFFLTLSSLLFLSCKSYSYSDLTAKRFWHYHKVSSCNPYEIENWTCPTCSHHTQKNMKDVQYFEGAKTGNSWCGYNPDYKEIVLVFQGSDDYGDWRYNLDPNQVAYGGSECEQCYVHSGFLTLFQDTDDKLMKCWEDLNQTYPNQKLVVTGYSLGGAQSQFMVSKLWAKHKQWVDYPYTFEAPRVGNRKFAEHMEKISPNAYRIIHDRDPVPHVPPYDWWHWVHANTEVLYNPRMTDYKIYLDESWHGAYGFWYYWSSYHTELFGLSNGCTVNNAEKIDVNLINPLVNNTSKQETEKRKNFFGKEN